MNDMQTNIERNVMRRVRLMRILGLIISTVALALVTLGLALWGIGKEVWVARVFENMPDSGRFDEIGRFYFTAFGHARLIVQTLAVITFFSFLYLVRATFRAVSSFVVTTRA